jgi:elongation factor P
MDQEDYNQFTLNLDDLGEDADYLTDSIEGLQLMLVEGELLGIQLPPSVVLTITETVPALKGGTAAARTKPATLETGLVIQVPEYISNGEHVKINTESGKFMSRA